MNAASIIILAIIAVCVGIAVFILKKNNGHTCGSCRGCSACDHNQCDMRNICNNVKNKTSQKMT